MRDIKDFGDYIANKRKEAGLTQESLARMIGITPQAVSKWENAVGYPDVTIFTELAKALNVSVSELFGETVRKEEKNVIPEVYRDLPKVYETDRTVCYSSKKVDRISEDGTVYFKGGSYANIRERLVINHGEGEIVLASVEEFKSVHSSDSNMKFFEKYVEPFESVELVTGSGNNEIVIESAEKAKVEIKGSESFISAYEIYVKNGRLSVLQSVDVGGNKKGRIVIRAPFAAGKDMHANLGGSTSLQMDVDFKKITIFARGNNCTDGRSADELLMKISGNSSVEMNSVKKEAVFEISGNSSISVKDVGRTKIGVSGNSSIAFLNVRDDMDISVSGNTSISASGEIDKLKCEFSGNGDFDGKGLTVNKAEVTIPSRGKVYLKRIKEYSVERIGGHGRLYVEKRGKNG